MQGITLAFGRFGSVLNDLISACFPAPRVVGAWIVGALFCFVSILAGTFLVALDVYFDRLHPPIVRIHVPIELTDSKRNSSLDRRASYTGIFLCSCRCGCLSKLFNELCTFRLGYWVLVPICLSGFPAVTSFNGVASALLSARWTAEGQSFDTTRINFTMGILYTVAASLSLFNGYIIDRTNRRGFFICLSLSVLSVTHAMFAFTSIDAAVLMAFIGLAFSFFGASFWPSIMWFVPHTALGAAYGLMGAFQNTGLAIIPLIVASLEPPSCRAKFVCVSSLFMMMSASGALIGVGLHFLERQNAVEIGDTSGGCIAMFSCCVNKPKRTSLNSEILLADDCLSPLA
jgi:hypothetical protein